MSASRLVEKNRRWRLPLGDRLPGTSTHQSRPSARLGSRVTRSEAVLGGLKTNRVRLGVYRTNRWSGETGYLCVSRSRKKVNHPIGGGMLDKFEKLIRDAIALLIKRGEIKIPGNGNL